MGPCAEELNWVQARPSEGDLAPMKADELADKNGPNHYP